MACARVSLSQFFLLRSSVPSSLHHSIRTAPAASTRKLIVSASVSAMNFSSLAEAASSKTDRWRPMCLYYTQGKCTKIDDASHLGKFNHNYLVDLQPDASELCKLRPQDIDYLLVLDLEGKVEILEFPVVMIETKTMDFVDSFHRFVRPTGMSEERVGQYIDGKYGKMGVDRVWHDTAILFKDALEEFEKWMTGHQLWNKQAGGSLHRAAFVTCGNWDLKTKIPQQCKVSKIRTPSYFMEWINLKDIYLNFYNRRATGMRTMMRQLGIPLLGSHHLGIDDAKNIARVLQRLLADGALLKITARRSFANPSDVEFLFKNRIV
ncbi:uncharacterized exonuclease domain-containing protein At3g15140 isoform X2 [Dendrobium catenatum]|uniref:Putative exonuclease domain-containing protein n=1 Tax=Dendrobium catenatum TaxID=906689 RepID=A0A2I0WC70_9ASPA|nr:uncharacterized exonuclease domain-containing protein At3g15140 isoform X2 [Dendrobium catenatum]PKU73257.1 putative exonuclease domain-containing protein [Dendrobium catenatum]